METKTGKDFCLNLLTRKYLLVILTQLRVFSLECSESHCALAGGISFVKRCRILSGNTNEYYIFHVDDSDVGSSNTRSFRDFSSGMHGCL